MDDEDAAMRFVDSPQTRNTGNPNETQKKRKGMALLIYDLKHRDLIPIKILTFILFAGIGSLFSFITIHMRSLGMTVEETGIINGVSSITVIFAPFLFGLIADKIGNFKVMMCALTTIVTAISLLFLLVPVGRKSNTFPVNMTLAMGCHSTSFVLTDLDSNICQLKLANQSETRVVLDECGYVCYNRTQSSENQPDLLLKQEISLSTQEFRDPVFFPKNWSLNVSCSKTPEGEETCIVDTQSSGTAGSRNLTLGLIAPINATNMFNISWMAMDDSQPKMNNIQCTLPSRQKLNYQDLINQTENNNNMVDPFCLPQCIVRVNRSDLCSNLAGEEIFNPQLTFGLYMLLRAMFDMSCGVLDLFVGASVALTNEVGGDYGFQRMFGFIGVAIFSPISGALIDHFTSSAQGNIRPAFYLFAGLYGIAVIVMLTINLEFKLPAKNPMKDVKSLLKNVEMVILLFAAFNSGICRGYGIFWLYPFLQEIGGTRSLMGLSNTLQSVVSIPVLLFSDRIFRKLSHPNVIVICFGVNVIRFIGYSYLFNPMLCLLFEPMEAIATSFARTSMIVYANQLGTTSTVASIQGLLSGIIVGLGWGVSSYGGSLLISAYGQRVTFRILGVISFLTAFIYLLFNFFYLRPRNNKLNNQ